MQIAMGAFLFIVLLPASHFGSRILKGEKDLHVQTLIAQSPIETFDETVFYWFPGSNKIPKQCRAACGLERATERGSRSAGDLWGGHVGRSGAGVHPDCGDVGCEISYDLCHVAPGLRAADGVLWLSARDPQSHLYDERD